MPVMVTLLSRSQCRADHPWTVAMLSTAKNKATKETKETKKPKTNSWNNTYIYIHYHVIYICNI